jgi:uncharacterized protein
MRGNYERLYIEFIYYFNCARDYFECHEVMEELWLEEGRNPLYQGLLQVAVGLYHHQNGNVNGAVKLLSQAVEKLVHYPGYSLGINLGKLLKESELYLERLKRFEQEPFVPYDLDIDVQDPVLSAAVEALVEHPPVQHEE